MSKPERFMISLGDDGVCRFCVMAGKTPEPLPYPPIRIPTKPRYTAPEEPTDGLYGKWKWDYYNACLPCAKKIIKKMKRRDIDPMED